MSAVDEFLMWHRDEWDRLAMVAPSLDPLSGEARRTSTVCPVDLDAVDWTHRIPGGISETHR